MRIRNIALVMSGDWEAVSAEPVAWALQIENPAGNNAVLYRHGSTGEQRTLGAGEVQDWTESPNRGPMVNELQIKGTAAETLYGEIWLENQEV